MSEATLTTTDFPEWTILYHGGGSFKGRGEFLRLLLEDKGVPYKDTGENLYGPTGLMDCFRGSADAILAGNNASSDDANQPNPVFFPPAIWHRPKDGSEEVRINQVGACMMYIGEQLGYYPSSSSAERARANCILLNCLDYIGSGRSSFHPVKDSMSYKDQKEEGDKASLLWSQTRMTLWLAHFEKVVQKYGPTSPVAGGENVTYADFALFHILDATVAQFNNEKYNMAWDNLTIIPTLKQYYAWMKARPNLKAYQTSDRVIRKW